MPNLSWVHQMDGIEFVDGIDEEVHLTAASRVESFPYNLAKPHHFPFILKDAWIHNVSYQNQGLSLAQFWFLPPPLIALLWWFPITLF